MKIFTPEEISNARVFFVSQNYPTTKTHLPSFPSFEYFILPQSLNLSLPDFVFRMTGKSHEEGQLYGISDSVREIWRPYAVAHEVIEFSHIGIHVPGRCSQALERELVLVPQDFKKEYVLMRRNFFRNLIAYALAQPQNYTSHDITEFQGSLNLLEHEANFFSVEDD